MIPTTKAEALAEFKRWLQSKHKMSLPQYDKFLQANFNATLKQSLSEYWNWAGLSYINYVITCGIEDELMK